ncbi:MAG: hypothetical protein LE178_06275 [Endomicrobium sp.]|nr:hypothetical protein [Endomicrobium sp.]MCA6073112.1 hypothetical protein [Endomicrobium sp.]
MTVNRKGEALARAKILEVGNTTTRLADVALVAMRKKAETEKALKATSTTTTSATDTDNNAGE